MKENYRKYGSMEYDYFRDTFTFLVLECYDEYDEDGYWEFVINEIDRIEMTGNDIAKIMVIVQIYQGAIDDIM